MVPSPAVVLVTSSDSVVACFVAFTRVVIVSKGTNVNFSKHFARAPSIANAQMSH